ncbi:MAG: hypothetical protein QOC77_227 [Thermoleophilaceae bacterium]|nr:hypothetical protein [Thermoleophilaceae bacterium]
MDLAAHFREDCRTLRDSLQLEMVVAQHAAGGAISAGVIAELERHGDPLSHAILRGLAHLGTGETAERSAGAVALLAEHGVGLPLEFVDVAGARALGAWRATAGGFDGEYALFADFEHPLGVRHALALFVEPRHGGVVKHIGLTNPVSVLDPDDPFHPSAMDALGVAEAGALLRAVLDRSFGPALDRTDDYRAVIAAARARSMEAGSDTLEGGIGNNVVIQ